MCKYKTMTQKEKLLQKFRDNPTSLSATEIFRLMERLGFQHIPNNSGTSHHKLTKNGKHFSLPIHSGECSNGIKRKCKKFLEDNGEI